MTKYAGASKTPLGGERSSLLRWCLIIGAFVAIAAAVAVILVVRNWPFTRQAVILALQGRFARTVEIRDIHSTYFPPMASRDRVQLLPEVAFYEEKQSLINEFIDANHVLLTIQNQQTQAVINDDPDFGRFDDLIHLARQKKEQVKYALIAHLEGHHC